MSNPIKLKLHEGGCLHVHRSLVNESLHLILLCTVLMLMFEDMLKVCSRQAAIFSNLGLQKCYFHKYYYF